MKKKIFLICFDLLTFVCRVGFTEVECAVLFFVSAMFVLVVTLINPIDRLIVKFLSEQTVFFGNAVLKFFSFFVCGGLQMMGMNLIEFLCLFFE